MDRALEVGPRPGMPGPGRHPLRPWAWVRKKCFKKALFVHGARSWRTESWKDLFFVKCFCLSTIDVILTHVLQYMHIRIRTCTCRAWFWAWAQAWRLLVAGLARPWQPVPALVPGYVRVHVLRKLSTIN